MTQPKRGRDREAKRQMGGGEKQIEVSHSDFIQIHQTGQACLCLSVGKRDEERWMLDEKRTEGGVEGNRWGSGRKVGRTG